MFIKQKKLKIINRKKSNRICQTDLTHQINHIFNRYKIEKSLVLNVCSGYNNKYCVSTNILFMLYGYIRSRNMT